MKKIGIGTLVTKVVPITIKQVELIETLFGEFKSYRLYIVYGEILYRKFSDKYTTVWFRELLIELSNMHLNEQDIICFEVL